MNGNKKAPVSAGASTGDPARILNHGQHDISVISSPQVAFSEGLGASPRAVGKLADDARHETPGGCPGETSGITPAGFHFMADLARSRKTVSSRHPEALQGVLPLEGVPTVTLPSGASVQGVQPPGGGSGRVPPEARRGIPAASAGVEPLGYMRISGQGEERANPKKITTPCHARVCVHAHGTVTKDIGRVITKPPNSGGKRGQIKEWSAQSRTRLRQALAMLGAPEGWKVLGFTGTIPGSILTGKEYRYLWRLFLRNLRKYRGDYSIIWRVELQARQQPHIHAVVYYPGWDNPYIKIMSAWGKAVDAIPNSPDYVWKEDDPGDVPTDWDLLAMRGSYTFPVDRPAVKTRMTMKGAGTHAMQVDQDVGQDDFSWWRYLCAHTGKKKQHQLGWVGRAWGIINPKHLNKTPHAEYEFTTDRQWWRFRRLVRRLLCYRGAGGGRRSVYYARPATVGDIVDWVKRNIDPVTVPA